MVKLLALLLMFVSMPAYAIRSPISTQCMVEKSDEILLAEFVGSSEMAVYHDWESNIYLAKFKIHGIFKTFDFEKKNNSIISLLWRKNASEYPAYTLGKFYILYLKRSDIGPYVLYGSRGAIEVTDKSMREVKEIVRYVKEPISAKRFPNPCTSLEP